MRTPLLLLALLACALFPALAPARQTETAPVREKAVEAVLDDWHDAAAKADFDRYFSHFTPDAVFMGTDDTERWSVEKFKAYAKPHFDRGSAWAFTPHDRHISFSADAAVAWFDEKLTTPNLGPCRGSGVLLRSAGGVWKIAHYNLAIPVPNPLAEQIVKLIRAHNEQGGVTTPGVTAPGAAAPAGVRLHVMSFNLRYDNPGDGENAWPRRRRNVAEFLRARNPDVVGMQEVLARQRDALLADLPAYASVGVGRDDGAAKGEFSLILYRKDRFQLLDSGTFWLSDTPEKPGSTSWGNSITRICTWARLREHEGESPAAGARTFYVFNVHLDHQSQPSREKGIDLVLQRIGRREFPDPVLLTGDFNAGESNPVVAAVGAFKDPTAVSKSPGAEAGASPAPPASVKLVDTFRAAHADASTVGTFNDFKGTTDGDKIDYIFVSGAAAVESAEIHRDNHDGRYLSDHFPISASVLLPVVRPR